MAAEDVAVVALQRCQALSSAPLASREVTLPHHGVRILEALCCGARLRNNSAGRHMPQ